MIPIYDHSRAMPRLAGIDITVFRKFGGILRTSLTNAARSARMTRAGHLVIVIVALLLVQGCTNSKLIISPLYNRLDDRIRDQFNELGEFSEEQRADFEASLGTFHVWHRQSELPQYAELLSNIAQSLSGKDTDKEDVQQWFDTVEQHSLEMRRCHPINFSSELMKSLTDDQLSVIERALDKKRQESRKKYAEQTPEERADRRLGNLIKWANRIDLQITDTQRALLLSTFNNQISLRNEYFALTDEWNRQFFSLLSDRNNAEFDSSMSAHLDSLWHILEDAYPEQWQANRDLWKQTSLQFAQSMTDEQRLTLSSWMTKMGSTLVAISKDEPSFTVVDDPSLGCLAESEES